MQLPYPIQSQLIPVLIRVDSGVLGLILTALVHVALVYVALTSRMALWSPAGPSARLA